MTEKQLIAKARTFNREAQGVLYKMYKTYWYMLCLRYNRNDQDAADVLQEALIQIFTKINQFDENKGQFKSWSGRIVINQSLMFLRKNRREQQPNDLDDYHSISDERESAIELLSAQELMRLVQQLPDGYRSVFNLYTLEGYNHKEIAAILNIKEGTSKSQLFKAKKMLREQLEVLYMT